MNEMAACKKCKQPILRKGKVYCSRVCWLSSEEYRLMRENRKKEIYEKSSLSLKGIVIPQQTRDAVSRARKRFVGPLHPNWNPDRAEQRRKTKLAKICYGLVGRILAQIDGKKTQRTAEELGYSPRELKEHLEKLFQPGMTWENHGMGPGKWHVDHVIPVCTFKLGDDPKKINSLENLRPLWEEENLSLGGRLGYSRRKAKRVKDFDHRRTE